MSDYGRRKAWVPKKAQLRHSLLKPDGLSSSSQGVKIPTGRTEGPLGGGELLGLLRCSRELSPDIGAMSEQKTRQAPVL